MYPFLGITKIITWRYSNHERSVFHSDSLYGACSSSTYYSGSNGTYIRCPVVVPNHPSAALNE